ncbi:MAG: GTP-binding protein [Promethearchaeota archaeon]
MEKIMLCVKQAKKRDIGRNIIRIDESIMENLNIKTGDVIEIIGKKRSAGIAWLGYPQDNGLGIARMESRLRRNVSTFINNRIEIRKITPQYAQEVILAPVLEQIRNNSKIKSFIKRKLNNYPVTIDDYIFISIGRSREIVFKVISIKPNEVCVIKQDTLLSISEKITEFNFLSNKQLKDLEKFLKKCDYSKEELVAGIEQEAIEENDWIRDSEVKIKHVIEYLVQENGLHWLISRIASDLYNKYEKTISQGQAEAIIKRVLDIKLSSTGRTQLYELRKKIRRYENFLAHFSDLAKIYDFTFKVVILGLRSEQATRLLLMPPIPGGEGQRNTLGVGFYPKTIEISDKKVKLQLWDISSESQWRSYMQSYCKGANGAILAYDKSNQESFKLVKEFYMELKAATNLKFTPIEMGGRSVDMPIILIGLGDKKIVSAEDGQSLANELGAYGYIEISETDTENFENALVSLSLGIITNYQNTLKRLPKQKFRFKIAVVGDGKVGKTSLIKMYTQGHFRTDYVKTIGAQYSIYDKEIEGDRVRYSFWDIAGSDSFRFLRANFLYNSKAAIIVYSIEENELGNESFKHIEVWYDDIMKFCNNIPIIIIGNKVDLVDETKLDYSKVQEFVNRNNLLGFYLTSAKTGQGIIEAFNKVIEELYNIYNIL